MLSDLLEKNRQNRMAFEYLMAWYLLTRQLDKFIQNLDRLDDFDYLEIPRHYGEAILLYMFDRRKPVKLHSHRLSSELPQRFKGFLQVYNRYGEDKRAPFNELAKNYGNSYFFYYVYGESGMQK
jgi:hypothetical protein